METQNSNVCPTVLRLLRCSKRLVQHLRIHQKHGKFDSVFPSHKSIKWMPRNQARHIGACRERLFNFYAHTKHETTKYRLRNSLKMELKGPRNTTVNFVKTTNSLRPQYSVEVLDPEVLKLLARRLEKVTATDGLKGQDNFPPRDATGMSVKSRAEMSSQYWQVHLIPPPRARNPHQDLEDGNTSESRREL